MEDFNVIEVAQNNIYEDIVVVESPKAIANEPLSVYIPIASVDIRGIASFDKDTFSVVDGKVKFKTSYIQELLNNATWEYDGKDYSPSDLIYIVTTNDARVKQLSADMTQFKKDINDDFNNFKQSVEDTTNNLEQLIGDRQGTTVTVDDAFVAQFNADGKQDIAFQVENVQVPIATWTDADSTEDNEYIESGYIKKAKINLGTIGQVTEDMWPTVIFDINDCIGANYCPSCETYGTLLVQGGVAIYAKTVPFSILTIPSIVITKKGTDQSLIKSDNWWGYEGSEGNEIKVTVNNTASPKRIGAQLTEAYKNKIDDAIAANIYNSNNSGNNVNISIDNTNKTISANLVQAIIDTINSKIGNSGKQTINGDLTVTNLTVTGVKTINTYEVIETSSGIMLVNKQGRPLVGYTGYVIRVNETVAYGIMYNIVEDALVIGQGTWNAAEYSFTFDDDSGQNIATRASTIANEHLVIWDTDKFTFVDSGYSINTILNSLKLATSTEAGVVKVNSNNGININNNGELELVSASNNEIADLGTQYKAITPNNIEYAVEKALGTNDVPYNTTEAANARAKIGAGIGNITGIKLGGSDTIKIGEVTIPASNTNTLGLIRAGEVTVRLNSPTATSGTLTESQLAQLQQSTRNIIKLIRDDTHIEYYKYDSESGGTLCYSNVDYENNKVRAKVIGIVISVRSYTLHELDVQGELSLDDTPSQNSNNPVKSSGIYSALQNKQDILSFDNNPTENSNNPVKSSGIYSALQNKQDALTFDDSPTQNSSRPVKSSGIYNALLLKQNSLTFDDSPSQNSNNPVKSSGIYSALQNKQNNLVFDNTPTENSSNPVKSSGIYSALSSKQNNLTFDTSAVQGSNNPVTSGGIYTELNKKQNNLSEIQLNAINSGITQSKVNQYDSDTTKITNIEAKIPNEASSTNKLADRDYVDTAVQGLQSDYLTSNAAGDSFAAKAALIAGPYYYQGNLKTPAKNDYAIVNSDESKEGTITRYLYDGTQWVFQYIMSTSMTAVQQAALDSGITKAKVDQIDTNKNSITDLQSSKQNVLTFDNTPTADSNNPVKSSGVYTALSNKQNTLTFDDNPTANSSNPVKSSGIYTALAGKQNTLTFDDSPSASSNNPVTSSGIYSALSNKQDKLIFDNTPTEDSNNVVNSGSIYDALQTKQNTLTFDDIPTASSNNVVKSGGVYTSLSSKVNRVSSVSTKARAYIVNAAGTADSTVNIDESNSNGSIVQRSSTGTIKASNAVANDDVATLSQLNTVDNKFNNKQDKLTFDNSPTSDSNNPVKSSGIYNALALKQNSLSFDNEPTADSNNVLTSGVIYTALQGKASPIDFDSEPVANSQNAVCSGGIYTALQGKQNVITGSQLQALNSGVTSSKVSKYDGFDTEINDIQSKIPTSASTQNLLADRAFVNSSVQNMASLYLTADAEGNAFASKAALNEGDWYFQGAARVPSMNDYAIVNGDSLHDNAVTRYMYDGTQWDFQYVVNNAPFTQAQLDAINSNATATAISQITTNKTNISNLQSGKQDKLTFDSTPISGSSNPVTSAGIYTSLQGKQSSLSTTQLNAVNSGITSAKVSTYDAYNTNKAAKSSTVNAILSEDNWGNAQQVSTISGVTASNNIIVSIAATATNAQIEAFAEAKVMAISQTDGQLVFKAVSGTAPTIDLPITVLILG